MFLLHWLYVIGTTTWFGLLANYIQNITGIAGAILWRMHQCRIPWCPRLGKHDVEGTTWRVCHKHHQKPHHDFLRNRHADKHPERLNHGES